MRTAITYSDHHEAHFQPGHVERPERLNAIRQLVSERIDPTHLTVLQAQLASRDAVRLAHPDAYFERLEAASEAGGAQLDPDTYTTRSSLNVALEGLGGLLQLTDAVLSKKADNAFALIRPPGHHARPHEAMGFCLFANAAIAAAWARQRHGVDRVLIVDFDVHHGNGTQEVCYESAQVLFMSTHQWPLYPGTGALEERGAGAGEGFTANVPLPAHTGDAAYLRVFREILRPMAFNYKPELILVSAGYDAHWMDPIASMNLSVTGFASIMLELLSWADALTDNRLVALLEGGYHADALAHSVLASIQLLQNPSASIDDPFGRGPAPDADVNAVIERIASFYG